MKSSKHLSRIERLWPAELSCPPPAPTPYVADDARAMFEEAHPWFRKTCTERGVGQLPPSVLLNATAAALIPEFNIAMQELELAAHGCDDGTMSPEMARDALVDAYNVLRQAQATVSAASELHYLHAHCECVNHIINGIGESA